MNNKDQEISLNLLTGEQRKTSPQYTQPENRIIHPEDYAADQSQPKEINIVAPESQPSAVPETKVFDLVSGQSITQIQAPPEEPKPQPVKPTMQNRPGSAPRRVSPSAGKRVLSPEDLRARSASVQKAEVEEDPKNIRQKAYGLLDESIKRRQNEFNEAMQYMIERDKENRVLIEEGVDEVVGEVEYLYLDPKKKEDEYGNKTIKGDTFDDDLERELDLAEDTARIHSTGKNIVIKNSPFGQETKGDTSMNDTERFDITPKIKKPVPEERNVKPTDLDLPNYEDEMKKASTQRPLNISDLDLEDEMKDTPIAFPDDFFNQQEPEDTAEDNGIDDFDYITPDELLSEPEADLETQPADEAIEDTPSISETDNKEPEDTENPSSELDLGDAAVDKFVKNHMTISKSLDSAIKDTDISQTNFDVDEEDFAELTEDEELDKKEEEEKAKKVYEKYRAEILQKVVNTASNINVSTFKVSKKVGSLQSILNKAHKDDKQAESVATWSMMNAGRPYMASALTGPEIVMLTDMDEGQSTVNANIQQTKILYNHDANPNKPASFNAWCKTIPYADLDELFMAIYIATFRKANYIPYYCTSKKCNNMELQEQKNILPCIATSADGKQKELPGMVKFADDKQKDRFTKIRELALTPEMSGEYETTVIPINSYIAIGFRLPSLYNMIVELRALDNKFLTKYAAVITVMMYIDCIYEIDNGELRPIQWKEYPESITKEVKSKVATYARILNTLSTSEYSVLVTYIGTLNKVENSLNYIIPESKCSECGTKIEERQTTGKELVFIYQHLMNIASTSAV